MNIFVLDRDPMICAQYHCDKHILKQIPDTAKILCTVMRESGIPYGYTSWKNTNHPCIKWAAENAGNFLWLKELGIQLCNEYTYRYGESGTSGHASEHIIRDCWIGHEKLGNLHGWEEWMWTTLSITTPPQCVPSHFENTDLVTAYRQYYLGEKADLLSYTKRDVPMWIQDMGMGESK